MISPIAPIACHRPQSAHRGGGGGKGQDITNRPHHCQSPPISAQEWGQGVPRYHQTPPPTQPSIDPNHRAGAGARGPGYHQSLPSPTIAPNHPAWGGDRGGQDINNRPHCPPSPPISAQGCGGQGSGYTPSPPSSIITPNHPGGVGAGGGKEIPNRLQRPPASPITP